MKTLYVCDKCGASYEEYDEASSCESSHLKFSDEYRDALKNRFTYKPRKHLPDSAILCVKDQVWDEATSTWNDVLQFGQYYLKRALDEDEAQDIIDEQAEIDRKAEEEYQKMKERWERERIAQEAKAAKEAAEQTEQSVGA